MCSAGNNEARGAREQSSPVRKGGSLGGRSVATLSSWRAPDRAGRSCTPRHASSPLVPDPKTAAPRSTRPNDPISQPRSLSLRANGKTRVTAPNVHSNPYAFASSCLREAMAAAGLSPCAREPKLATFLDPDARSRGLTLGQVLVQLKIVWQRCGTVWVRKKGRRRESEDVRRPRRGSGASRDAQPSWSHASRRSTGTPA